mmetsp:Transcript_26828/g.41087  ORF Transcript_26828/g.41087 Transcript_26828/m.41087 type:complete len:88 (+) Transcript_26828:317-580(+)
MIHWGIIKSFIMHPVQDTSMLQVLYMKYRTDLKSLFMINLGTKGAVPKKFANSCECTTNIMLEAVQCNCNERKILSKEGGCKQYCSS